MISDIQISEFASIRASTDSFTSSHFTETERNTCLRRRRPDHGLAARYAAREALVRACEEVGIETPLCPQDAEVIRDAFGAPAFRFSESQKKRLFGYQTGLSLAHDGNLARAVVILQGPISAE